MGDNSQLFITDKKMLELMSFVIEHKVLGISTQKDFLGKIGMDPTALRQVKNKKQGFTIVQIYNAVALFKINANWLFGAQERMFNESEKLNVLKLMKEAVFLFEKEYELKRKSRAKGSEKQKLAK